MPESFKFDPKIHLDLHEPAYITDLDFKDISYPTDEEYDIAFAAQTKVFSDEGVKVLR